MELIGRGREAEVFAVNDVECIKLFYERTSPAGIENEARIMHYISTLPIRTPKYLGRVEQENRHGIRMERLHGISMLEDIMRSPERIEEDAMLLGRMQREYHEIKAEGLESLTDKMIRGINWTPLLTDAEKLEIVTRLRQMPEGDRLIHTDYHVDNVIVTDRGAYIIDWPGAACGNPLADVARTYMSNSAGSYPIGASPELCEQIDRSRIIVKQAFLRGYGVTEEEIAPWFPFVAAFRLFCAPKEEVEVDLCIVRNYLQKGLELPPII